jgi:hypothetical protein
MIERQDKLRMRRENKKLGLPVSATPINFSKIPHGRDDGESGFGASVAVK